MVLKSVKEWLDWHGVFCFRVNQIPAPLKGGGFRRFQGMPGVSDLIGILPSNPDQCPSGRFLAIECKRPKGGRLSEAQEQFLARVNELGGVGIVVDSLESLEEKLGPLL